MATIEELPKTSNGARRFRLYVGSRATRKTKVVYADGKRHAQTLLDEWRAELGESAGLKRYGATIGQEARRWLDTRTDLARATRTSYGVALDEFDRHAESGLPLSKVKPADIKRAIDAIGVKSPDYARRVRTVLHQALRDAVIEGKIPSNPVVAVRPPSVRPTEIDVPAPDVVFACIAEARKLWDQTIAVAIHLAAATGARRAELCGLRWTDLRGTTLHVDRAVNELSGGGWEAASPKTAMSRRPIALDNETLAILKAHRKWQTTYRADVLEIGPQEWILGDVLGWGPRMPLRLSHEWGRIRSNVPGAEDVRFHALRHFHATQLLDLGIPVPTVAGRLGHASGVTTIKIYGHRTRRADQSSADAMGKLFGKTPNS